MKAPTITGRFLLGKAAIATISLLTAGQALAQAPVPCPDSNVGGFQLTGTTLLNQVNKRTVCAQVGGDRWQEFHSDNGDLIDYKKGPADPVDPSETVGTWSISGDNVVYDYGTGGAYTYALCSSTVVPMMGTVFTFVPNPTGTLIQNASFIPDTMGMSMATTPQACP